MQKNCKHIDPICHCLHGLRQHEPHLNYSEVFVWAGITLSLTLIWSLLYLHISFPLADFDMWGQGEAIDWKRHFWLTFARCSVQKTVQVLFMLQMWTRASSSPGLPAPASTRQRSAALRASVLHMLQECRRVWQQFWKALDMLFGVILQ